MGTAVQAEPDPQEVLRRIRERRAGAASEPDPQEVLARVRAKRLTPPTFTPPEPQRQDITSVATPDLTPREAPRDQSLLATAGTAALTQLIPGPFRGKREEVLTSAIEHTRPEELTREIVPRREIRGRWGVTTAPAVTGADVIGAATVGGAGAREAGYLKAAGLLARLAGTGFDAINQASARAFPRVHEALRTVAGRSTATSRAAGFVEGTARGGVETAGFGVGRETMEQGPGLKSTREGLGYAPLGVLRGFSGAAGARPISRARSLAPEMPFDAGTIADDPFRALGLDRASATPRDVDVAFRRRATPYHPDRNPTPEAQGIFAELSNARRAAQDELAGAPRRAGAPRAGAAPTEPVAPPPPTPADVMARARAGQMPVEPPPPAPVAPPEPVRTTGQPPVAPPPADASQAPLGPSVAPEGRTPDVVSVPPERPKETFLSYSEARRPLRPLATNSVDGREDALVIPDRAGGTTTHPVRYVLADPKDILNSHSLSGGAYVPRPGYPTQLQEREGLNREKIQSIVNNLEPELLTRPGPTADSGPAIVDDRGIAYNNHRVEIIRRVYEEGGPKADALRASFRAHAAEYGIAPEDVDLFPNPIIVRQLLKAPESGGEARTIAQGTNIPQAAPLTSAAEAVTLSRNVPEEALDHLAGTIADDETLAAYLNRAEGQTLARRMRENGALPATVFDKGVLTSDGKRLVGRVLAGRVVSDATTLDRADASVEDRLIRIAPSVVKAQRQGEVWDLTPWLAEATKILNDVRDSGLKMADYFDQHGLGLGETPEWTERGRELAALLHDTKPKELQERFREYARDAAGRPEGQGDLMAETIPTREPEEAYRYLVSGAVDEAPVEAFADLSPARRATPVRAEPPAPSAPAPATPERIRSAAVRLKDGSVWEGSIHVDAMARAQEALNQHAGLDINEIGFVTDTGRFVDKAEAAKIAKRARQVPERLYGDRERVVAQDFGPGGVPAPSAPAGEATRAAEPTTNLPGLGSLPTDLYKRAVAAVRANNDEALGDIAYEVLRRRGVNLTAGRTATGSVSHADAIEMAVEDFANRMKSAVRYEGVPLSAPPVEAPRAAEPAPSAPAGGEPWQMTRVEFEAAVRRGTLHKATGSSSLAERGAKTPLSSGEAAGYSPDDIAHFYARRRGFPESDQGDYSSIDAGREEYVRDAVAEGKPVPPEVLADYPDLVPAPSAPAGEAPGAVVYRGYHGVYSGVPQRPGEGWPIGVHVGTERAAMDRLASLRDLHKKAPGSLGTMSLGEPVVLPMEVRLKRPFGSLEKPVSEAEVKWADIPVLRAQGYDGAVYRNLREDPGAISVVAFDRQSVRPARPSIPPAPSAPAWEDPDYIIGRKPQESGLTLAEEVTGPDQGALFGEKAGTEATRSTESQLRSIRADLEMLRTLLEGTTDPAARRAYAARIADLERAVNPDKKITAEEMAARAAGEAEAPPDDPNQLAMLSPATPPTLLRRIKKAMGMSPEDDKRARALIQISKGLADALDAILHQGRGNLGRRKAHGVFDPKSGVMRVQRWDMLDTVAHEAGHFVSEFHLARPTSASAKRRGVDRPSPAAMRELVQMGKDLYGSRKPASGYGEEGIAEWFSFYVTEHDVLTTKAPAFTLWMGEVFKREPVLKAAFDAARGQFEQFAKLPAEQKIDVMVAHKKLRTLPDIRDTMTAIWDDLYEFKHAMAELGGATTPDQDFYILARMSRGGAKGEADEWLKRGVSTWSTSVMPQGSVVRLAPGVEPALSKIGPKDVRAFQNYLAAERALENFSNGIDSGFDRDAAKEVAEAGRKNPVWLAAGEAIWRHYNALIEVRVAAGLLDRATADIILPKNQRHVGMRVEFDPHETAAGSGRGAAYAQSSTGLQRQHGSARRKLPPLHQLVEDTYQTAKAVKRYAVMRELVKKALETKGGGKVLSEVPAPLKHMGIPAARLRDQLADLGLVQMIQDAKTGEMVPVDLQEGDHLTDAILTYFYEATSAGPAENKDLVIPFLYKGERKWYQLNDARLRDAVLGLNRPQVEGVMRFMHGFSASLRLGATMALEFSMARNPARDMLHVAIFSRGPTRFPGYHLGRGFFSFFKQDDAFQRWVLTGGKQAGLLGADRAAHQRRIDEIVRDPSWKGTVGRVVKHPIDAMQALGAVFENAPRIGEMKLTEEQALKQGARPRAAAVEATINARDVSIDFEQGGKTTNEVNSIYAFFRARVRAWAQMGREFGPGADAKRRRTLMLRALAFITVPSLALYYYQRNDPVYRDMPLWRRAATWILITRGRNRSPDADEDGPGWDGYGRGKPTHVFWFPKPHEMAYLFGTLPEFIAEYLDGVVPDAMERIWGGFKQQFGFQVMPNFAQPLVENYANRSSYRQAPIVPTGREDLDPGLQYRERTGEAARTIGQVLGYSPAKLENIVTGWTGGVGQYGLDIADLGVRAARAAVGAPPMRAPRTGTETDLLGRIPAVRAFVGRVPTSDAESVTRVYRDFAAAERHRRSLQQLVKEGRTAEAATYRAEHLAAIQSVATREEAGRPGPLRAEYERLQAARRQSRVEAGLERPAEPHRPTRPQRPSRR